MPSRNDFILVLSVSYTQGSSSGERICLLALILGDFPAINPPLTPALSRWERELVFGNATLLPLGIVTCRVSFGPRRRRGDDENPSP